MAFRRLRPCLVDLVVQARVTAMLERPYSGVALGCVYARHIEEPREPPREHASFRRRIGNHETESLSLPLWKATKYFSTMVRMSNSQSCSLDNRHSLCHRAALLAHTLRSGRNQRGNNVQMHVSPVPCTTFTTDIFQQGAAPAPSLRIIQSHQPTNKPRSTHTANRRNSVNIAKQQRQRTQSPKHLEGTTADTSRGTLSQPQSLLDSSLLDPFDTSREGRIDENATLLLKYYANDIVSTLYASSDGAARASREYIQNALADPACLNAMAYRALGEIQGWQLISKHSPLAFRASIEIDGVDHSWYKNQTVQHLSQSLQGLPRPVSPPLVCAVLLLLAGEIFLGNREGMRTQLIGLKALVDISGGLQNFHAAVVHPAMTVSILASALLQERPLLPPPPVNDGQVSQKTLSILDNCRCPTLDKLGKSFLNKFDIIGSRLLELVLTRRRFTLFQELCQRGFIRVEDDEFEYFYAQLRNVEYELASLRFEESPMREVIRLAMLTFSYGTVVKAQKSTSAYTYAFVAQLKDGLDATDLRACWVPHTDLLCWVLFLGAHASKSRRERTWYIMQLARR